MGILNRSGAGIVTIALTATLLLLTVTVLASMPSPPSRLFQIACGDFDCSNFTSYWQACNSLGYNTTVFLSPNKSIELAKTIRNACFQSFISPSEGNTYYIGPDTSIDFYANTPNDDGLAIDAVFQIYNIDPPFPFTLHSIAVFTNPLPAGWNHITLKNGVDIHVDTGFYFIAMTSYDFGSFLVDNVSFNLNLTTSTTTTSVPPTTTTTVPPCEFLSVAPFAGMGIAGIFLTLIVGFLNIIVCVPVLFAMTAVVIIGVYYYAKFRGWVK